MTGVFDADRQRRSLRAAVEWLGTSVNGLAVKAGIQESTPRRFLDGETQSMHEKTWTALATAAGMTVEQIKTFADNPQAAVGKSEIESAPGGVLIPAPATSRLNSDSERAPVFAPVWSEAAKKMKLGSRPAEVRETPNTLRNVEGAFGVLVTDSTMEDKMEPNDIAWVHPTRPPKAGKYCVFLGPNGEGGPAVLIRRLVEITDTHWKVVQLRPRREYLLSRVEWPRACLIRAIEESW